MKTRRWNGRYHEQVEYRWVEQVPIKAGAKALRVNWCEITIVREDTGKQMYHNAWITSHKLTRGERAGARRCRPCPLEG